MLRYETTLNMYCLIQVRLFSFVSKFTCLLLFPLQCCVREDCCCCPGGFIFIVNTVYVDMRLFIYKLLNER